MEYLTNLHRRSINPLIRFHRTCVAGGHDTSPGGFRSAGSPLAALNRRRRRPRRYDL